MGSFPSAFGKMMKASHTPFLKEKVVEAIHCQLGPPPERLLGTP